MKKHGHTASSLGTTAALYAHAVGEALAETLWPTRCAVCDRPGAVLCEGCRRDLPYLDWWQACPRCGAPFGRVQCTECNDVTMGLWGLDRPPFDACASATVFDDDAARVVRTWKDAGERRLVGEMARLMGQAIPPEWLHPRPVVVPIPATAAAARHRGFDHGAELAGAVAEVIGTETATVLATPRARDQRELTRGERLRNMEGRFSCLPGKEVPARVLLVDDVYTTGATLFAASEALRQGGAETILALTFARVW